MKILMVVRWPVGGIRTFIRDVYSNRIFEDCRITLLAPGDGDLAYFGRFIPPERFRLVGTPGGSADLLRAFRKQLRQDSFDLVHSHGLKSGIAAEAASLGVQTCHLVSMHDVFLPGVFSGLRGRAHWLALNLILKRCAGIHAVGHDCADNFRQHMGMVDGDRVHAIVNGINADMIYHCTPIDARRELKLSPDTRLIGFFGRFMAQKGFRTLVDSIEFLVARGDVPPLRVLTFGDHGFVREDYSYIEEKGLRELFLRLPHTDEPERWMKAVDVIAMPSRWEACPLQPMEALVAGAPLVGTDCIGMREVLAGSPAWVVPPGSPQLLAEALADAIERTRDQAFEDYRSTAVKRFDVLECASGIRRLYDQIVGGSTRR